MEGLSTQLQLLQAALQQLDFSSATLEDSDIVPELQMILARATALVHWLVTSQQVQCPSATAEDGENKQAPRGQKTPQLNEEAADFENEVSPSEVPEQRGNETVLSVASSLRASVEQLRKWNPQLPRTLKDTDVLPPNTFLKVRYPKPSITPKPLVQNQPSSSSKSPPLVMQSIPRLAAQSAASASRSAARSSCGQSSEQRNHQKNQSSYPPVAAAQTCTSAPGIGDGNTTANNNNNPSSAALNVNASVSSNMSGSASRPSLWTGESARGASHSPQVLEPSMPGGYASAEPPTCAPAPVMLGMVEVLAPPSQEGKGECRSGQFYLPGEKPSPSPQRQLDVQVTDESVPQRSSQQQLQSESQPQPRQQPQSAPALLLELTKSPSPISAVISTVTVTNNSTLHELPSLLQQQQQLQDIVNSGGRSPLRASMGTSSSGTSIRGVRTRGHSQSLSDSSTMRSTERNSQANTPWRKGAVIAATSTTSLSKSTAASAHIVTDEHTTATSGTTVAAATGSKSTSGNVTVEAAANLSASLKAEVVALTRRVPEALVNASEVSILTSQRGKNESEVATLKNTVYETSVSLSAVSATTSAGDERGSSILSSVKHTDQSAAGVGGNHTGKHQQHVSCPLIVMSPSLEAPSSVSSISPIIKGSRRQQRQRQTQVEPIPANRAISSLTASTKAAAAADTTANSPSGLGFSTPIQQQHRAQPLSQNNAAAKKLTATVVAVAVSEKCGAAEEPSCSPISPSSYTSSSSEGSEELEEGQTQRNADAVIGTPMSRRNDYDESEIEDTPSTRIPAMLGRHVCSPPPTLSRTRRMNAVGAAAATAATMLWKAAAHTLSSSPYPPSHSPSPTQATGTAASSPRQDSVSAKHPSPSPSPSLIASQGKQASPEGQVSEDGLESNGAVQFPSPSPNPVVQKEPVKEAHSTGDGSEEEALDNNDKGDSGQNYSEEMVKSPEPHESEGGQGEDEYDTLEGIAAAYKLTVATIVEWNPYLKKYRPSEPLPPDLPVVLPMSDNDEEEYGAEDLEGGLDDGEAVVEDDEDEDELYCAESEHQPRNSGTPLDTTPSSIEDSPAPIPPTRYE